MNSPISEKVENKEQIRSEVGRGIARLLYDAVKKTKPENSQELLVISERIDLCNRPSNLAIIKAKSNPDNNPYAFGGHLWQCRSRLCPSCLADLSRRNRKLLRQRLLEQPPLSTSERYSFLTLTIENLGLSFEKTAAIVQRAWDLFRKREFWVSHCTGAAKSEEFTITSKGYHYHIHLLCRRSWWSWHTLRHEWSECVRISFEEAGLEFSPATRDGMLWVKDKPCTSFNSIVKELCKYMTKANSFKAISNADLIHLASIVRWPRMFELLGTFNKRQGCASDDEASEGTQERGTPRAIVHTTPLIDGSKHHWRKQLEYMTARDIIYHLHEAVKRHREFRLRDLRNKFGEANVRIAEFQHVRTFEDALDTYHEMFES